MPTVVESIRLLADNLKRPRNPFRVVVDNRSQHLQHIVNPALLQQLGDFRTRRLLNQTSRRDFCAEPALLLPPNGRIVGRELRR